MSSYTAKDHGTASCNSLKNNLSQTVVSRLGTGDRFLAQIGGRPCTKGHVLNYPSNGCYYHFLSNWIWKQHFWNLAPSPSCINQGKSLTSAASNMSTASNMSAAAGGRQQNLAKSYVVVAILGCLQNSQKSWNKYIPGYPSSFISERSTSEKSCLHGGAVATAVILL